MSQSSPGIYKKHTLHLINQRIQQLFVYKKDLVRSLILLRYFLHVTVELMTSCCYIIEFHLRYILYSVSRANLYYLLLSDVGWKTVLTVIAVCMMLENNKHLFKETT